MTERTEPRETICAVAQDIMPLMLDNVCSPESRSFVEEHVRNCEGCREALALMQAEDRQTPSPEEATENRAQWKGVRRYCKRLTSRGFLLGLAVTILAAVLAAAAYWQLGGRFDARAAGRVRRPAGPHGGRLGGPGL